MKYFLTLGTQPHQFNRLINYATNNIKSEDIIMQVGLTKYSGKYNHFDFSNEFDKYINECEVVITHGGVGSIIKSLLLDKKVIAVARLNTYEEHVDDHQLEVVNKLAKEGYILMANNEDEFKHCLEVVNSYKFKKYISNKESFNNKLLGVLDV